MVQSEQIFGSIASTFHCDPENPPCSPRRQRDGNKNDNNDEELGMEYSNSGDDNNNNKKRNYSGQKPIETTTSGDDNDNNEYLSTIPLSPSHDASSKRECSTVDARKGHSSAAARVQKSNSPNKTTNRTKLPRSSHNKDHKGYRSSNGSSEEVVVHVDSTDAGIPEHVRIKVSSPSSPGGNGNNKSGGDQVVIVSPKHRASSKVPTSSPRSHDDVGKGGNVEKVKEGSNTKGGRANVKDLVKKHTSSFPFGKWRTLFPITMSLVAIICSILCKESTNFVTLDEPIYIDAQHETIQELGLFWMELCRTEEFVTFEASGLVTRTEVEYEEDAEDMDDLSFFYGSSIIINEHTTSDSTEILTGERTTSGNATQDCRKYKLDSNIVHDGIWNAARILVGFTTGIGFLFTAVLTTTVFWNSVNLIVVAFGIFFTYLCQCFAFLFYDSTICKKYVCYSSTGTTIAVVAALCWFLAGIGTLCMYLYDRNEKHRKEIEHLRNKTIKKRRETFLALQWSIFDLFKPPSSHDTEPPSSADEGSKSSM